MDQGGIVGLQQGHVTENCHKAGQGLQAKVAVALFLFTAAPLILSHLTMAQFIFYFIITVRQGLSI